jgi:uncharacterized protein
VSQPRDLLRLNVGFIIHQNVGYVRDFPIEIPSIRLQSDLDLENLFGVVRVSRAAQGLLVQVKLKATVYTDCVRCLTNFFQPLDIDFSELYAFNRNSITDSGLLVPESGKIDLEPFIRDEMLLAMPINPLCRINCKGLCPECGENLNDQPHVHQDDLEDPRLSALKALLDQTSDS